ncbi:molybdate ABC transporter permease subunit [Streptomyces jeddahensis]|uniref:Molybdenum transport system permease n=1 Tax=Streptomyces jeddahensis TaxID=1716141 RepID=A0A177HJB0_9ACTN|nr:molybdate ABC transporter permease subunit [Streptomyces jeddahensis]OAH10304.1 molybdenum transport system permease protein ModB [Streptomyces jeddahensis]
MDWFPLLLSLRVAATATALAAVLGIGGGYLLAKGRFRGRGLLEALASLPIVLPPTVLGYYLLVLCGNDTVVGDTWQNVTGQPLVFTPAGAVLAATVASLPFCLRTARAAIESVDPRLEQAARTMGLPEWQVAARVTLPLARRGIIAGVALGCARALGDFGATVMVAGNIPGQTQTMPIAVYDAVQAGNDDRAALLAIILSLVAVAVLILVNRFSRNAL